MNNLTIGQIKILRALDTDEMYGYEIMKFMNESLGSSVLLGSLYNTLKSLERKKLVESYWSNEDTSGGRRKYFKITGLGQKSFREAKEELLSNFGTLGLSNI